MPDSIRHHMHPVTPDGRYFLALGRLWRRSNPNLPDDERVRLTFELIAARSDAMHARRDGNADLERDAMQRVDAAKVALGQRGAPWWDDGAPDYARAEPVQTPYADWLQRLDED